MENLENISKLMEDLNRLQKRSQLLELLLKYYDEESMTFIIPEKWKGRIREDKYPAKSPRHLLLKNIKELLDFEDLEELGFTNKYDYL